MYFAQDPQKIKEKDGRGGILHLDMGQRIIIILWGEDGPEWRIPIWEDRDLEHTFFLRRKNGLFVQYEKSRFIIIFDDEPISSPYDIYYPILSQNVKDDEDIGYIREQAQHQFLNDD